MLRILKFLILAPIAILALAFAYANRGVVSVSFDPLASGDSAAFSLDAPLFVVIILALMIGIVCGSVATWFGQGRNRRLARQLRNETEKMKADLDMANSKPGAMVARRA